AEECRWRRCREAVDGANCRHTWSCQFSPLQDGYKVRNCGEPSATVSYLFDRKTDAEMIKDIATDVSYKLNHSAPSSDFEGLVGIESQMTKIGSLLQLDSDEFSYDALNHEDKLLFLHIACFFNGEQVDIVEGCLAKCFLDVTQGLRVLAEKSLISMESRAIQMAELLVHLGRKNVLEQSVSDPGKRQFLNGTVDIGEVLSDDKAVSFKDGCSSVIGIDLKEEEDISCTSERSFERLTNLQFLRISGNGINPQSLNYISQKLRVLVWSDQTRDAVLAILRNCGMKFDDSDSLEELPDLSTATNLQELDLSFCSNLEKLPFSIGNAINLRKLDLKSFSSLVELPSSIGNAVNLKTFLIFNCTSLLEIPSTIATITNLKSLRLSGCSNLVELPFNIESVTNAMCIDLRCCSSLMKLPSSIGNAIYLQKLDLSHCSSLVKLPSSIGNILSLEELKLSYCSSLVELPSSMKNLGRLSNLKLEKCLKLVILLANINLESLGYLNLSDCSLLKSYPKISTDIQELDPWTGRISSLQRLVLSGMKKLVSLPLLPNSLLFLDAENCESLERLDFPFGNPDIRLNFINCFKLNQEAVDLIILTLTNQYAVFPAAEVPQCFTYQSSGSSLTVKLNQKPLGISTKFKACIICADGNENGIADGDENGITDLVQTVYCSITSEGNALTACHKRAGQVLKGHLYIFEVEVETEEMTSTELVFEFLVGYWHIYEERINSKTWEIKECGVLQLQEVPLLSIRDVNEDNEPSYTEIGDKPWNPSKTEKHQEKKSKITGASSGI
ncbi:hypothetical protein HID58_002829, partial [Brassica napus]